MWFTDIGSHYLLLINLCITIIKVIVIMITIIKKYCWNKKKLDAFSSRLFRPQQYSGALHHAKGRTWSIKQNEGLVLSSQGSICFLAQLAFRHRARDDISKNKHTAPSGLERVHSIAWRYDMKSPRLKSQKVLTVMRKKDREGEGAEVDLKVHMGSVQLGFF